MAVLDRAAIIKICKERPNLDVFKKAVELNERLLRFTHGYGLEKIINNIDFLNSLENFNARKKLQKTAVDLYERVTKLRGKVFTAKGGSRVVMGLNENQEKELIKYLSAVRNGISLRKYIEQSLLKAWDSDPMGICVIELSSDEDFPEPYPTYKNSSTIYAASYKWRSFDYLFLSLSKEDRQKLVESGLLTETENKETGTFLRVLDDEKDVIVCYKGDGNLTYFANSENPNVWGRVPAFILGNIPDIENKRMLSTIECILEPAERYMQRDADIAYQEHLHGTLKYWTHPVDCSKCKGTGKKSGNNCSNCNGTGKESNPRLGQSLVIPFSTQDKKFETPPAGFIVPPKDSFQLLQERITHYEQRCMETYWSQTKSIQTTGPDTRQNAIETATEVLSTNTKEEAVLNLISDWKEETETIITNYIGEYLYPNFEGASVTAGRRYIIKSPDELLKQYEEVRKQSLSESLKDDAYADYLESKYEKDPVQLAIQYKLMQLEPFFHFSINELKAATTDPEILKSKLFFGEWKRTKTDMELFYQDLAVLIKERDAYVSEKQLNEQPQNNPVLQ